MKHATRRRRSGSTTLRFCVVVASFCLMILVLWWSRKGAAPEPLGAARAAEREAILAEVRRAESDLVTYDLIHAEAGIHRIPVDRAMEAVVAEWQDNAAARAEMARRVDLMAPPPPAPVLETPSPFE